MDENVESTIQEMQLNEMMHVDIKIGIDMQSRVITDAGGAGRSHGCTLLFVR